MRLRRHGQGPSLESSTGIDLAPMLDFVLNLLIFFIITAVFAKEVALSMNRAGGGATAGTAESDSLPISIMANGDIWLDNRVVDVRAVRANVERAHATKPKLGVLVIAQEEAEAGVVIQVVDQIRLAGVDNISFSSAAGTGG
ncbi:MAG: biopolymer transporter ExbD [Deltaproteobacteria bacterium]|nr:biopolymer transporter ExbD [Deltaproteobacteria bacterium]